MYTLVRSAHSSVGTSDAASISRPPIVGVPAFVRCVAGPSCRMTWPTWKSRNLRISQGPSSRLMANAVRLAAAVRNVMYRVTLRTENVVCSGKSR